MPLGPARARAARRALAAARPGEEARDPPGRLHRVGAVVHDDDRSRAEHRSGRTHRTGLEGQVEVLLVEPGRGGPTGDERLQLGAVTDAAAVDGGVDEVAEGGDAELDLVDARVPDVARHREHAGAATRPGPEPSEGCAAPVHDPAT